MKLSNCNLIYLDEVCVMSDNRNDDNEQHGKSLGEARTAEPNRWDSDNQSERASAGNAEEKRVTSVKGGGRGKHNNPGNFANNRARAAEAGRKGGEARGSRHHQQH